MNLVLGSTIDSLRYTDNSENSTLIFVEHKIPFELEEEHGEYLRLLVKLNLQGKIKFCDKVSSILVKEDNIKVFLTGANPLTIRFNSCRAYDTTGMVVECSEIVSENSQYAVYDWFKLTSISGMPQSNLNFDTEYFNKVWFINRAPHFKTAVVRSYLSKEQASQLEYSDVYTRFHLLAHLKKMGFLGRKNGFNKSGDQIHLALDAECTERQVLDISKACYKNTKNLNFFT